MNSLMTLFVIAALGYLIGRIKIKSIMLGSAGVLLVALIFGHFGAEIPSFVRNLGLVLFVSAVGFSAGPKFFRDFKHNAKSYILLGIIIIVTGSIVCILVIKLFGVSTEISVGLMTGALTSTPGLAAAQEAAGEGASLATTGYAIAYPFGVIGVVLFVQLLPKILRVNVDEEVKKITEVKTSNVKKTNKKLFSIDNYGFFSFSLAIILGMLIGHIVIPLPGGSEFSLGDAGGPLLVGLVFGHFAHFGPVNMTVPKATTNTFREFGLMLFLIGAGVDGGKGFVETLQQEGAMLFVYGALMTLIPMIIGFFVAHKLLHLSLLNSLGSITGGMTSTPALGSLIQLAGTDDVATSYAATYPIALVLVVICSQFITILT